MRGRSVAFLISLAAAALPATSAPGAEHSVRPDGLGDFPTIQAAVDSAAAGDVIVLEDGVFTGTGNRDVTFGGKDLTVRSRNGASACTIDSQGAAGNPHRAFRLDSGETAASRIEGITMTGGYVQGPFPENGGGGILVAYGTHPVITDCVFDGNEAGPQGFGAGLLAWEDCDITLTDCVFVNGVSGDYGGGFVLRKYCDALVERCVLDGNYALHAGGGASITNSNAVVNDCTFTNNWTTEAGGGGVIVKAYAQPVFNRCVFAGNSAYTGGGIGMGNFPIVTANDCLFEGNVAFGGSGGAVETDFDTSEITLQNCTLVSNSSYLNGEHVWTVATCKTTLRNCILDAGCAGLYAARTDVGATLDIDCSVLVGGTGALLGSGTVIYGPDMVDADPRFCSPAGCNAPSYPSGDYTLDASSPAATGPGACGLIGAYSVGCSVTGVGATLSPQSWGRVKGGYRGR